MSRKRINGSTVTASSPSCEEKLSMSSLLKKALTTDSTWEDKVYS